MVPFVAVSLAPIRLQDHRATTYFRNQRCNPDIRRAAKLLIDQHGEDASGFAVKQADKRAEAGDMEGRRVWLRVIRVIQELQRTRPRRDEPAH